MLLREVNRNNLKIKFTLIDLFLEKFLSNPTEGKNIHKHIKKTKIKIAKLKVIILNFKIRIKKKLILISDTALLIQSKKNLYNCWKDNY